jgi:frataxin-like iron-binding protein CyaY
MRFEYDPAAKQWLGTRDRRELLKLLQLEVQTISGVEIKVGAPGEA